MDLGPLAGIADGLGGIAEGVGKVDPIGNLIDLGGTALGLPPALTNAVKVAVGIAADDPLLIISGSGGLLGSLGDMLASGGPQTELSSFGPGGQSLAGYAPAQGGGELMSMLPGLGSDPGGADPAPILPAVLSGLAVGGLAQTLPASDPAPVGGDLSSVFAMATPRPPGGVGGGSPGLPPPPGSSPGPVSSAMDPDLAGYRDSLRVLQENFATFDSAVGLRDGRFSREGLETIVADPRASATLKDAARFLLDHPLYFNRLEMAAGLGGPDRVIGQADVGAELGRVEAQLRTGATPSGVSFGGGLTPTDGYVRDVVSNPNMSIEDKIQAMLEHVTQSTDSEIEGVMQQMAAIQDQRANTKDAATASKLDQSYEQLQLRLQKAVERRQQMFQLMSNMSEKFNEMAKVAIQNLARA